MDGLVKGIFITRILDNKVNINKKKANLIVVNSCLVSFDDNYRSFNQSIFLLTPRFDNYYFYFTAKRLCRKPLLRCCERFQRFLPLTHL